MLSMNVEKCGGGSSDGEVGLGSGGEVGRLVDSSQADDRRLIRLVRERRLLYARNNMPVASYYSQVKKLWQQIAKEMGWTVAEVRRKWSHIRNSYSRHLRNELHGVRTGRGRIVSKWYLADELYFLREHMATDTRPCRYSYAPLYMNSCGEEPEPTAPAPEPVDIKPFTAGSWLKLSPASQHPQRPDDSTSTSPRSFDADENSAYFQFFRGIYNDYQELPASKQRLFRRECLSLLHRMLDQEEEEEEEVPGSERAMNLSSSHYSDEDRARTMCIIETTVGHCVFP